MIYKRNRYITAPRKVTEKWEWNPKSKKKWQCGEDYHSGWRLYKSRSGTQYDINGNHSVWDDLLLFWGVERGGGGGGRAIPAQEKLKNVQAMEKYFMHNPKFRKKLPQKIPLPRFQKNKMVHPLGFNSISGSNDEAKHFRLKGILLRHGTVRLWLLILWLHFAFSM